MAKMKKKKSKPPKVTYYFGESSSMHGGEYWAALDIGRDHFVSNHSNMASARRAARRIAKLLGATAEAVDD